MASQDSTTEGSKNSSSDENHKPLHSRFPAPGQATRPPFSSVSKSDDESGTSTPPPKTDQSHKKDKKKKQQPSPPPSVSQKTAATKMSAKRRIEEPQEEEEENDGVREPPTKKKTLHAVQQESSPRENKKNKVPKPEPVSTQLSPQKSHQKVPRIWNPKDELDFFNGLLAFCKKGKGLPKNIAPVYDHIRNTLDSHYSNRQFTEKCSRWKIKFRAAKDKMKVNALKFRSAHEAAIYNICKQLWGGLDEGGAENEEIDEDHSVGDGGAQNVSKASMNVDKKKKKKKLLVAENEEIDEDHSIDDGGAQNVRKASMNGEKKKKKKKPLVAENEEIDEDRSVGDGGAQNVRKASMNGDEEKEKKKKPVLPEEEDIQKTEDQEDQRRQKEEEEDGDQEDQVVEMEEEGDGDPEVQGAGMKEEEDLDQEGQGGKMEEDEDQEDQRRGNKEEEEEGEDDSKTKKGLPMNKAQNVANGLAKPNTRKVVFMSPELYSQFREERDAMVAEVKKAAVMILKESELKRRAMIEDHFNSRTDHLQPLNNQRFNGFHSARGAPVLSGVKAKALEQKWHEQQILEMEAYSKRLDLLQEECKVRLEELKTPVRNGGY